MINVYEKMAKDEARRQLKLSSNRLFRSGMTSISAIDQAKASLPDETSITYSLINSRLEAAKEATFSELIQLANEELSTIKKYSSSLIVKFMASRIVKEIKRQEELAIQDINQAQGRLNYAHDLFEALVLDNNLGLIWDYIRI